MIVLGVYCGCVHLRIPYAVRRKATGVVFCLVLFPHAIAVACFAVLRMLVLRFVVVSLDNCGS
jgi:hypothetical protein